ncbi:hypothetical protein Tco_0144951 [Tanacetum coccineum]
MGGVFSLEARDMDMKLLSALESNNTLARCWFRRNIPVTKLGLAWQVTVTGSRLLPVAGPLFLQFLVRWHTFWSDSIRPKGFLSSALLWLVIIVAVVGVGVTVVVVVIVAVVVVESSYVIKLLFVIT